MAEAELPGDPEDQPQSPAAPGGKKPKPVAAYARPSTSRGPGFFHIYKKGQGYWTRMGTLIGVAILGLMLTYTLYSVVPSIFFLNNLSLGRKVGGGVAGTFLVLYTLLSVYLMNKPSNVDFLIATDGEMKKVNWTSKRELMGSTKVVIAFMFLTALFLFVMDLIFGEFMHLIGVLKSAPFH